MSVDNRILQLNEAVVHNRFIALSDAELRELDDLVLKYFRLERNDCAREPPLHEALQNQELA